LKIEKPKQPYFSGFSVFLTKVKK